MGLFKNMKGAMDLAGQAQHVCWVSENANGSRGFGFTGGHFHKNWQNDQFRRVVLNAIGWIAKADVPAEGIHPPGGARPDRLRQDPG